MIVLCPHSTKPIPGPQKDGTNRSDSGFASTRIIMVLLAIFLCACAVMALQENAPTGSPHGRSIKNTCSDCHTTAGWKPIRTSPDFDHGTTGFELKEMHKDIDCAHCHLNLNFSNIGTQCTDCHADIHRRQLGADCEECHTLRGWSDITQTINGHQNRFPLMGAHSALECESCHTSAAVGQFRGLSTDCNFCHQEDYLNASSVDHQGAGFSLNCELCHSMDGWLSRFNHSAFTGFALAGAHATLDCLDCHSAGNFAGTPADCVECHIQDYNGTTDPDHLQADFSQDCSLCHTAISWLDASLDATFNHNGTQFPLTGAHTTLLCQDCHNSGQYAGLPSDCYACHSQDYTSTSDPGHIAAGFSQDCTECHTTSGWGGAAYAQHNSFPIYSGRHNNAWTACSECHTNSGNYAVFSCFSCHGKTETDSHHRDEDGYVYNSANCYACHSDGRADD